MVGETLRERIKTSNVRFETEGDLLFQLDELLNKGLDLFDNFRLPVELGIETEFNRVGYDWPDSSVDGLLLNDGSGGLTWIPIADITGSLGISVPADRTSLITILEDYTTIATDHTILCNAATAAITVSLIAAALFTGLTLVIKKIDSSANAITIDGNGAETIDDDLTVALLSKDESVPITSDGSNWSVH